MMLTYTMRMVRTKFKMMMNQSTVRKILQSHK